MATTWDDTAPIHNPVPPTRRRTPSGHLGTIPVIPVKSVSQYDEGQRFRMEGFRTGLGYGAYEVVLTGRASQNIGSPVVLVEIHDKEGGDKRFIPLTTLQTLTPVQSVQFAVGQVVNLEYKRSGIVKWVEGDRRAVLAETSPGVFLMTYRTVGQLVALNPDVVQAQPAKSEPQPYLGYEKDPITDQDWPALPYPA